MTDTFRKEYIPLSEQQKAYSLEIKTKAEELETILINALENNQADKRLMAIARTNLEQTVMWAVKAVTTKQEEVK